LSRNEPMILTSFTYRWLFLLLTVGVLLSCSRASNPDIERGSGYYFQSGYPEVRFSALGILNEEDEGLINIAADIVEGSLIFREQEGVNRATLDIEVRIAGVEGTSYSDTYTTTIDVDSKRPSYLSNHEIIHFSRDLRVPPGEYEVLFSVMDHASGNRTTLVSETFIPDPADERINLTAVRLLAKQSDREDPGYVPVTTYDVSTVNDSIRFVVQVTNNRLENPIEIRSRMLLFPSDQEPSRPMSFQNYSPSSLPYKGIDFARDRQIDETHRVLEQPGSVLIEYRYALPERGNYRFEVRVNDSNEEELFKARDFAVMGKNFPNIRTPRELAEPLIYLMNHNEHARMMEIESPDSLKAAVDRFWLSNVGSANRARQVISLYYERVEEANKQFTNFKEGWKTDLGMIYILFGPPWYVDRRLNHMQWIYSFDRSDPRYNFYFQRPRGRSEFYPFNNYLLQRDQSYFSIQYQQVERWLTGEILNRSL